MAKYYVESGTMQMVVQADDERKAALWAVHRAMQQILPMYDNDEIPVPQKHFVAIAEGWMTLGDTITLNELGFGRNDGISYETFDVVTEWNQLMIALAKIEQAICG